MKKMLQPLLLPLCGARSGKLRRLINSLQKVPGIRQGVLLLLLALCLSYTLITVVYFWVIKTDSIISSASRSTDAKGEVDLSLPHRSFYAQHPSVQAERRRTYTAVETRVDALKQDVARRRRQRPPASKIIAGARDPNEFRMRRAVLAHLPLPEVATAEGEVLHRPAGTPPLPQLLTQWRTYTPMELYERYDALYFVYSFVNGSESSHHYRKKMHVTCGDTMLRREHAYFVERVRVLSPNDAASAQSKKWMKASTVVEEVVARCAVVNGAENRTLDSFYAQFSGSATAKLVDQRDRETDELRHSIRSVEQHVRWHRGRVVIVSPGHYPTWVDAAKNFLAGRCGDKKVQALRESGTHLRLTTVHQDALLPYGMRLTANSHTIEQHLWRVRNITPVHVYMNDDYFVNRDVAITDLFNEYGGTIVRTESERIAKGESASSSVSWLKGVYNTELFNIHHLESLSEDYLPPAVARQWADVPLLNRTSLITPEEQDGWSNHLTRALRFQSLLNAANTSFYYEAALASTTAEERMTMLPNGTQVGTVERYFSTHAPFVYCTNMFRHFSVRFQHLFARIQLYHRNREARDILVPFLYNAYIMMRPWEASPQFLPSLLELQVVTQRAVTDATARLQQQENFPKAKLVEEMEAYVQTEVQRAISQHLQQVQLYLDNEDGCAPATLYRSPASDVTFMLATNNVTTNRKELTAVAHRGDLYFNINSGFDSAEAAAQIRQFLHDKFPDPLYLEAPPARTEAPAEAAALAKVFNAFMQLPIIGLVSDEEGACPLLRSLALAFADQHHGPVHLQLLPTLNDSNATVSLRQVREALHHPVMSALPVPQCAYASHIHYDVRAPNATIREVVQQALPVVDELERKVAVELPSTCGESGAGLRVRGFVVDARTPGAPVMSRATLREALAVPGQTLALEDFRVVTVGPGPRDVVLVLAREDAAAKAVHWVTGGAENDLLVTYPLPVPAYEDMSAPLKWSHP